MDDELPVLAPRRPCSSAAVGRPALAKAVGEALDTLGCPSRLSVIVNDPQRHTDSRAVLRLLAGRTDLRQLRVLVATGTHRFGAGERRAFQEQLTAGLPGAEVRWHDCRDAALVPVAEGGWRGHPWLLEGPALLAVGSVEPHYFAGLTGAHKTVTVGCASWHDIESNHAGALEAASRPCRLAGNPVFEGVVRMLADLSACREAAAVDLVQVEGEVIAAAGGPVLSALESVRAAAEEGFVRRIGAAADAIVAEASGPLGRSFYQADKAIKNNESAVRDGGTIVLVAGCEDGIGQDHFVRLLEEAPTAQAARQIVARRGYRLGDHKAVRLRALTDPAGRAVRIYLVSDGLSDSHARVLGLTKARSVREAFDAAGIDPARDCVYRLLDAGNLCVMAGRD